MPLPNGQTLPTGGAAGNMATYYPPATGPAAIQQLLTSPRPGGPPPGIFNPSGRPMNDYGFVDANGNNIPSPSNPQPVISPPAGPAFGLSLIHIFIIESLVAAPLPDGKTLSTMVKINTFVRNDGAGAL